MPQPNDCPNCAPYDCYHICPNSPHYYSAEQERADDATYGDLDRWEGYGDPELCYEGGEVDEPYIAPAPNLPTIDTSDDLPF
jgi:hypothetical protein